MANWYVSTTGSDTTGDGSVGNPWATPWYAADQVYALGVGVGGQIYVEEGVYNRATSWNFSFNKVYLKGAGQNFVGDGYFVIDYQGNNVVGLNISNDSNVAVAPRGDYRFEFIHIRNTLNTAFNVPFNVEKIFVKNIKISNANNGIVSSVIAGAVFSNVFVENITTTAINFLQNSYWENVYIKNSTNGCTGWAGGLQAQNFIIAGCTRAFQNSADIRNCIVYNCGSLHQFQTGGCPVNMIIKDTTTANINANENRFGIRNWVTYNSGAITIPANYWSAYNIRENVAVDPLPNAHLEDFTINPASLYLFEESPSWINNSFFQACGIMQQIPPPPTFPDAGKVAFGVDRGDGTEGTRTDAPAADVRLGVQYGDPADLITGEFFCFELDGIQPTATEQSTVEYGTTTDGFTFIGEISTVPATALTVTTPEPDKISFELPASVSAGNYTVSLERSDGARANTALSVLPLGFPAVDSITSPVNVGEILTIHGENFGALAGSAAVVVGGVCAAIVSWEDDKIEARPSLRIGSGSFGVVVVTQNGLCAQSADPLVIDDALGQTDDKLLSVDQALVSSLIDLDLGIHIAHENFLESSAEQYDTESRDPFCDARVLPNELFEVSNKTDSVTGVFRITLYFPLDQSSVPAKNMADIIFNHYRIGKRISYRGQLVTVTGKGRQPGVSQDGWYNIIVDVKYQAFLRR